MDLREVGADHIEAVRAGVDANKATMWTALPGIIQSFDPQAMTCEVQPAIQGRITQPTGGVAFQNLPVLVDCPVVFPRGGGVALTFPLAKGDECLIVFASRCIDAWWQQGGPQPPMEARMHDLSDGFVIPGPWSQPAVPASVSTTAAQLRSNDGSTVIALDPTAQTVAITAPGGATITADVTINGTLHVTGQITSDTDVVADSVSLKNHVHGGVKAGSDNSGEPQE